MTNDLHAEALEGHPGLVDCLSLVSGHDKSVIRKQLEHTDFHRREVLYLVYEQPRHAPA